MKNIKVLLEYDCFPVWYCNEEGFFEPDFDNKLKLPDELWRRFEMVSKDYDNLFTNNEHEFSWNGFSSVDELYNFIDFLKESICLLREVLGSEAVVQVRFDFDDLINGELKEKGWKSR